MRMTNRLIAFGWLLLVLIASAEKAGAQQESLRITPTVSGGQVLVSFELTDAYSEAVREAIASGLRTTFTFELELRTIVPAWMDRTIAKTVVSTSDQYD